MVSAVGRARVVKRGSVLHLIARLARGVFVLPRPEKVEAYFGSITDAAGRHTPPSRPTDATALDED